MDKTDKSQRSHSDKRDFFRVSHDVIFDYKVTDAFTAENNTAENEFDNSVSLHLLNELRRLDRDSVQTLRLLTEKNRLLGDYLRRLNSKIDLIARHSLFAQDADAQNKPTTRINLSEDGLAFICERALYKDSFIVVRLIFLPSYSPVQAFAKVLRCDQKDKHYQVGAKFFRLDDVDRQEISRHILRAQAGNRKKVGQV